MRTSLCASSSEAIRVCCFLQNDDISTREDLFRDTVTLRATPGAEGWSVYYGLADEHWAENQGRKAERRANSGFAIPLRSSKGFKATLWLKGVENPLQLAARLEEIFVA